MGNLCRFKSLVALTKPEQPTAARKHDTEEDAREAKKTKGILRCMKGRHTEREERAKTASFLKSPISSATRKGEIENE